MGSGPIPTMPNDLCLITACLTQGTTDLHRQYFQIAGLFAALHELWLARNRSSSYENTNKRSHVSALQRLGVKPKQTDPVEAFYYLRNVAGQR